MRELKFRAWIEKEKYMALQGEPDLETLSSFMYHYSDCKNLMQYTGLKDKNGKEIYEGDILGFEVIRNFKEITVYHFAVTWDFENAGWIQFSPKNKIVVIGNIYENPELLKSSE